ncbi:Teichoic acid export ATP-binding protein TagH [hydrothermal vent metagenome]|uniref:Teichoic acid export ATP-binding protein TagH n=1 Tax=hydrothermal vent metagenome TaxID=652676 RepID=A0A3B1CIC6_9ZZZZ
MPEAIKVENLSKRYIIFHEMQEKHDLLMEAIAAKAKDFAIKMRRPFGLTGANNDPGREEFWAIRDINFSINVGDRVGIVGRNGAGKSTLLKVLSRITKPTTGKITLHGKVSSLLEVGTGFHPELSGRENIYMNGSILGMHKNEVNRKFDAIVDFSGIEKFLDTPVKRYSSGMYVRLAFAVAAHLEPDVLLVDEVLAVGDIEFQKKCLNKMEDISNEGRTVVFVSHNMSAVAELCDKGILIDNGKIVKSGDISEVLAFYKKNVFSSEGESGIKEKPVGPVKILSVYITDQNGKRLAYAKSGELINVIIEYQNDSNISGPVKINYMVTNESMYRLLCCSTESNPKQVLAHPGRGKLVCTIPSLPLPPGNYQHNVGFVFNDKLSHLALHFGSIPVTDGAFFENGHTPKDRFGLVLVKNYWDSR